MSGTYWKPMTLETATEVNMAAMFEACTFGLEACRRQALRKCYKDRIASYRPAVQEWFICSSVRKEMRSTGQSTSCYEINRHFIFLLLIDFNLLIPSHLCPVLTHTARIHHQWTVGSSVSVVTKLRTARPKKHGSSAGEGNTSFLPYVFRTDRGTNPTSYLFNVHCWHSLGRGAKLTSRINPVSWLRMRGVIPPLPHMPSRCAQWPYATNGSFRSGVVSKDVRASKFAYFGRG
jgi:hypothetical protein